MRFRYVCLLLPALWWCSPAVGQDIGAVGRQKPVAVSGGINLRGMFYDVQGIPARRQPFTYIFSGALDFQLFGFQVPLSFLLSEQERSFRQPFNQFGASPTYKWITLHAGYRNISFSPFTLDGFTMLGGGFELRPGKWHIGGMYGRLNRAVTANQVSGDLQPVAFTRKGAAGKIGYGTDTTNFQISFVKGKDDAASLDYQSLDSSYVTPAENLVVSAGGRVGFLKHFFVEAEGAVSVYTRNIETNTELDSVTNDLPSWLSDFITVNGSTEVSRALRAGIGYRVKTFGLSVQYRRIDPGYQSMGAYFFQNDVENYTINPMLLVWQGRLRLTGSIGIQRDNLLKQKQATARRVISSANASVAFTQRFGIDLSYSNYASSQNPTTVTFNDSVRVAQTTQNFSFTPHYFVTGRAVSHAVTASANYMLLNDFSLFSEQRDMNMTSTFLQYQVTFQSSGVSLLAGLNYTRMETVMLTAGNQGVTIGGGKTFFKNKLQLRLTNSILQNKQGAASHRLYTHGFTGSYRAGRHHAFSLNANYTNNLGNAQTQELGGYPRYRELRGEVAYNLSF